MTKGQIEEAGWRKLVVFPEKAIESHGHWFALSFVFFTDGHGHFATLEEGVYVTFRPVEGPSAY